MVEAGKHQQGAMAGVFSLITTRRTKLFAYGFVLSFVAGTAFLAFSPSSSTSSPWFNTLFTSSSISSSIAPYRSQFSSLVSHFFPNSSSPSSETPISTPISTQITKNQTEVRAGSAENGVGYLKEGILANGSPGDGVSGKNQTVNEVGSAANGFPVKSGTNEVVGSKKNGVLARKNDTGSGTGLQGNGIRVTKQTKKVPGSAKIGASMKNQTKAENGSKKVAALAGKNQTGSGTDLLGSGVDSGETGAPAVMLQTGKGAAFQGNEAPATNQKDPTADSQKNQTAEGVAVGVKKSTTPAAAIESKGKNQTEKGTPFQGNLAPAKNQKDPKADSQRNLTADGVAVGVKKSATTAAATESKGVASGDLVLNLTAPVTDTGGRKRRDWIDGLVGCDMYHGRWVRDDSYPLYPEGSCPHIDEPFDCFHNGRPDRAYQKLRWQTNGCQIPRLNATDMLERLRGKRLVFVGDSLNRNMWESLVCALRHSVKDKNKVFEMSGQREFRTEGSYSFLFKDYGCTVEYFRTPFLVQEWEMAGNNGTKKETLRLDIVEKSASKYKDAYIIVFNTGHWWTHEKTSKGKDYYQEGNHVYGELNVAEAFHRALSTWAKWVDSNVNPKRTHVFFRGYSVSHFSGGQWNSGGQCDKETEPIKNEAYLSLYPPKMSILEEVIKGMKNPVSYMNVTRMTDYRKDAHPSIYQKPNMTEEEKSPNHIQDCSHWCLPGVPDSWNELLYAEILIKQHQKQN